ncbi:hypothetical protein OAR83_00630 [Alphaproteobacteria bacterium]|nr:hypothetical protein [Alphaproteobacteria bacterium]
MIKKFLRDAILELIDVAIRTKIRKFEGLHDGQEVYILGGGHSIKYMDLSVFKGKTIIGTNLILFHRDFDELNVKYVTLTQPRLYFPSFLQRIQDIKFNKCSEIYREMTKLFDTIFFVFHYSKFVNQHLPNWVPVSHWVHDPSKKLRKKGWYGGAFYSSLTLAHLMGFKKINLVGFDAITLKDPSDLRWYEYGTESKPCADPFDEKRYLEHLKEQGLSFFTIGVNSESNLETVEYIEYQDLDKSPTEHKENFDLIKPIPYLALKEYPYNYITPKVKV